MPGGYFVGEFDITDPAAYEVYRAKVPDIISAYRGRILVRGGDPYVVEAIHSVPTVKQRAAGDAICVLAMVRARSRSKQLPMAFKLGAYAPI
jgi:hypothetical protein